jgi:hypothetical protein
VHVLAAFASFAAPSALLLPLLVVGCGDGASGSFTGSGGGGSSTGSGGGGSSTGSGGGTGGSAFVMAPHPAFPVLTSSSENVIAHPKLVTITFPGDVNEAAFQAVGDQLVTSQWVKTVGADYGVGEGTHLAKVVLPEPAPAKLSDPDLLTTLDQQIGAGLLPKPAADIIYIIHIPAPTDFEDPFGTHFCSDDYLGYHYWSNIPSGKLTYAIVADCTPGAAGFDDMTTAFAHEYIEAASDPYLSGYLLDLSKTDPWVSQSGSENADLCQYNGQVTEAGYTYPRVWSNSAAAAAVTSPCAPIDPAEVFYDVFADPGPVPYVAAGETATFTLTGWSTAPVPDWALAYATDYGNFVPIVQFSAKTINNGKTVTLTLGVPAGTPKGKLGTAMIYSGDGYGRFWPVSVWSK